jgi:hypothetical protein
MAFILSRDIRTVKKAGGCEALRTELLSDPVSLVALAMERWVHRAFFPAQPHSLKSLPGFPQNFVNSHVVRHVVVNIAPNGWLRPLTTLALIVRSRASLASIARHPHCDADNLQQPHAEIKTA